MDYQIEVTSQCLSNNFIRDSSANHIRSHVETESIMEEIKLIKMAFWFPQGPVCNK